MRVSTCCRSALRDRSLTASNDCHKQSGTVGADGGHLSWDRFSARSNGVPESEGAWPLR